MQSSWLIRLVVGSGLALAGWAEPQLAQGQQFAGKLNPNPKKEVPKEYNLDVSPQKLPDPLFRYRLVPPGGALNPGNAAPVYLRLDQQTSSERINEMNKQASEWLDLPLSSFPQAEARKLVEEFAGRFRQLEYGTRRQFCDWDYTINEEKENPFAILLPDAQAMRGWGRLLGLRARTEIAAGQPEPAIGTIETGIAFGRHVGEGPFYINKLIGLAMIGMNLNLIDELIGQPGTPNLYWALTALPRPLVDMRAAAELERLSMGRTLTGQSLEATDLNHPRSDAEWSAWLGDLHTRMIRIEKSAEIEPAHATIADLAEFRKAMAPQARDYLKSHDLTATTDDQALVKAIIGIYRELTDENFKLVEIPYHEAVKLQPEVEKRNRAAKEGPAGTFSKFLPATMAATFAEVRIARKVAILRVVEALRLHAAEHDGQLPTALDQIQSVPIPSDPLTGQPFPYRLEGATAILEAPITTMPPYHLIYRITVRK